MVTILCTSLICMCMNAMCRPQVVVSLLDAFRKRGLRKAALYQAQESLSLAGRCIKEPEKQSEFTCE